MKIRDLSICTFLLERGGACARAIYRICLERPLPPAPVYFPNSLRVSLVTFYARNTRLTTVPHLAHKLSEFTMMILFIDCFIDVVVVRWRMSVRSWARFEVRQSFIYNFQFTLKNKYSLSARTFKLSLILVFFFQKRCPIL